jgi:hypothetical protein
MRPGVGSRLWEISPVPFYEDNRVLAPIHTIEPCMTKSSGTSGTQGRAFRPSQLSTIHFESSTLVIFTVDIALGDGPLPQAILCERNQALLNIPDLPSVPYLLTGGSVLFLTMHCWAKELTAVF